LLALSEHECQQNRAEVFGFQGRRGRPRQKLVERQDAAEHLSPKARTQPAVIAASSVNQLSQLVSMLVARAWHHRRGNQ
jgi:hypothetical protein